MNYWTPQKPNYSISSIKPAIFHSLSYFIISFWLFTIDEAWNFSILLLKSSLQDNFIANCPISVRPFRSTALSHFWFAAFLCLHYRFRFLSAAAYRSTACDRVPFSSTLKATQFFKEHLFFIFHNTMPSKNPKHTSVFCILFWTIFYSISLRRKIIWNLNEN
jgi:hypothetical protein